MAITRGSEKRFLPAKAGLRALLSRPGSPFELRCIAPSVVVPGERTRATFQACFSEDWAWVTDLATGGRFAEPRAWAMDCRRRAGCIDARGISVKSAIYYHGISLAQHERAAVATAAAPAACGDKGMGGDDGDGCCGNSRAVGEAENEYNVGSISQDALKAESTAKGGIGKTKYGSTGE